jgi:Uma2 family endonuclease
MSTITAKTSYTPEVLLAMPDEKNYELVDGHLVERNTSTLSSWVAGELLFLIRSYCQTNPRGWVLPEGTGYQCFPASPKLVRKPDVSFVSQDRLPPKAKASWEGYLKIAPDLAVEVISPKDLAYEIDRKVIDYLAAGVPLVWVIHPETCAVSVHRRTGPWGWLQEEDELSGEDILPGFRCRVGAIFPPWAVDAAAPPDPA